MYGFKDQLRNRVRRDQLAQQRNDLGVGDQRAQTSAGQAMRLGQRA